VNLACGELVSLAVWRVSSLTYASLVFEVARNQTNQLSADAHEERCQCFASVHPGVLEV